MKKIRIGNDFVFNWAIERGGLPEDLESVLEAKLTASVFGKKQEVPFTVSGNIITIEFTPEICNVIGSYNLLFAYILPDTSLSDEDRKCAVDVDAFQIVAKTAQADDPSEFTVTSDMAIAFKGDKGDSAYQVWLEEGNTGTEEDYFAYLRQPATDAAQSANEAAGLADTARTELTTAVNTKLGEADDKIEEMDTTLSTYDGRVTQVESDITQLAGDVKDTTEKPTAQSLSELNARITALEEIISNKIKDRIDVTKEFNVWGKTNLILYGDGASTKAPDFIGQTYIDTTNGSVYIAVGNSNAGNWKLV